MRKQLRQCSNAAPFFKTCCDAEVKQKGIMKNQDTPSRPTSQAAVNAVATSVHVDVRSYCVSTKTVNLTD